MFDFSIVTNWIHELLLSIMPEGLAIFIECVAVGVCLVALYAILAIILIYMERKVCGFFQCRLGPNRVGKWGSIQVVCDVLKMLTKEIFMPKGADHFLYNLAPFMVIIASFLTFACIPFNKGAAILDFNVGVFLPELSAIYCKSSSVTSTKRLFSIGLHNRYAALHPLTLLSETVG